MTVKEINDLPFVFIVGMGRSGTTLLRTILDAGDESVFPSEAKIIIHLKQKYNHRKNWRPEMIDEFIEDLYTEIKFARSWKINPEELRKKMHSYPIDSINFPFLCRLIYLSYPSNFKKTKISLLGDKNPVYSIFIEEILEVFPNARFIHIVRDYRDCILSNQKLFKRKNVAALAQLWKMYNTEIEICAKKYPEKFYRLKYEDLTFYPERTVSELCGFTGLTFHPKMLDFHIELNKKFEDDANKEIQTIIKHTHPQLLKKVNTDNVGKWKNELSEHQLEVISYLLNDFGGKYGYDKYEGYRGSKHLFRAFTGYILNLRDVAVIKGYFLLPFSVRTFIRKISRLIFTRTGFFTVFNQGDVLFDLVKNKKEEPTSKE